jgi:protein O-GlcNAc transferase
MDAAASMIEKAIIANPTYGEAYNNLGNPQPTVAMWDS